MAAQRGRGHGSRCSRRFGAHPRFFETEEAEADWRARPFCLIFLFFAA